MADDVDITQERLDYEMSIKLSNLKLQQTNRESLSECKKCNANIPEARRTAVKGCTLCTLCQTKKERKERLFLKNKG